MTYSVSILLQDSKPKHKKFSKGKQLKSGSIPVKSSAAETDQNNDSTLTSDNKIPQTDETESLDWKDYISETGMFFFSNTVVYQQMLILLCDFHSIITT